MNFRLTAAAKPSVSEAILDASAVLAFLQREPGENAVRSVLPGALLSTVNAAEVYAKLSDRGVPHDAARSAVVAMRCTIVPFSETQALASAQFRRATKAKGLSLGDRCCLALAQERSGRALTTEKTWKLLGLDVDIEQIR
jgi:PIN domain nuclease of toxin-antitoxin system